MIHTGVTSTGWRRAARRIRSFTAPGRSRHRPGLARRSNSESTWMVSASLAVRPEDGLEVDHRRPVDGLERTHADPRLLHGADAHPVQAHGVRTVRRAGGEDPGPRVVRIISRMDLEHGPIGLMQPGEDEKIVARPEG